MAKGTNRKKKTLLTCGAATVLLAGIIAFVVCSQSVGIEETTFTESNRQLDNPNRGLYSLHGFRISDEDNDYEQAVAESFQQDGDTMLALVQINLQAYSGGAISQTGIVNIEKLFRTLESLDKQLIVRFVYDWDGKGKQSEPKNLQVILTQMEQMSGILKKYSSNIFIMQGLFTGNWGEMNGTNYSSIEDLKALADQLAKATDDSTYLSVRTPAQWRSITSITDPTADALKGHGTAARLGLYNDGMLGNETDYGTYGEESDSLDTVGASAAWNRQDELDFQETLCSQVPNGGEVIEENERNDLDQAIADFATMHVTYLNQDYDKAVLDKWKRETVTEEGCFWGMDGYSYIERHLGYRLLIADTDIAARGRGSKAALSVDVTMQNVGFAPLYRKATVQLVLRSQDGQEEPQYCDVSQSLSDLKGGNESEQTMTLHGSVPLKGLPKGTYTLYISIVDSATGKPLSLANEQDMEAYGYALGTIEL